MARVRSRNTTPERMVRSILHKLGYRFRLHSRKLAGEPDLVFPSRRVALFVHGCFWHRHQGCKKGAAVPVARQDYWSKKFAKTVARDKDNQAALLQGGWRVLVIWECQLKNAHWLPEVQRVLDETEFTADRQIPSAGR